MHVHILAVDAPLETQTLRAAAESFGLKVTVTWAGNADQIVEAMSLPQSADLFTICGHGDARGLILPVLAGEAKARYRFHDAMSASDMASFARLAGAVVLNTSCAMGGEDFARAFLGAGAHAYIGAEGYPDGDAALMYALSFLYAFGTLGAAAPDAHAFALLGADDDRRMFRFFR